MLQMTYGGFQLVAYDVNGPLMNDNVQFMATINNILAEFGKPIIEAEVLRRSFRQPWTTIFRDAGITEEQATNDDLYVIYNKIYKSQPPALPFDGLRDTMRWLRRRRVKLAVISSQQAQITLPFLDRSNIIDMFDYFDHSVSNKAEALARLCQHYRLGRYQVAYVGDQVDDVKYTKEAGCFSVGFEGGLHTYKMLREAGCGFYMWEHSDIKLLFR